MSLPPWLQRPVEDNHDERTVFITKIEACTYQRHHRVGVLLTARKLRRIAEMVFLSELERDIFMCASSPVDNNLA